MLNSELDCWARMVISNLIVLLFLTNSANDAKVLNSYARMTGQMVAHFSWPMLILITVKNAILTYLQSI